MKAIRTVAVVVGLVVVVGGCASTMQSVRSIAAQDLRCPATSIRMASLPDGAFRAEGCGRRAYYLDDNAFSATSASNPNAVYFQHSASTASR